MDIRYCYPASGTIRTTDERIEHLYLKAGEWVTSPCMWEGLFRIACLLKNNPCEEPVYRLIYRALDDTEDGSLAGTVQEQIQTVRAALAVFEYNTDRKILKRIALWLRFLEIEYERLSAQGTFLYQPADLMELLVRYYQITGMKSVLRLCAKLRATAFDWTTALHTFQQTIPIGAGDNQEILFASVPDEMDYHEKEKLINHAELLADGVRFTLFSGIFSGHGQELTAGKAVWTHLVRHHHALCGGTSASPYLSGSAPDQKVESAAIAAWTEAFASQLMLADSDWALEELIRIIFNGLADCVSRKEVPEYQRINSFGTAAGRHENPERLYARITRAVAAAYQHSVALKPDGIRIQYLLPGRVLLMMQKQPVLLKIDQNSALFQCKEPFDCDVYFFCPLTETSDISMIREGREMKEDSSRIKGGNSVWIRTEGQWLNHDGFKIHENHIILCEETHHQGVCFIKDNRLYSLPADREHYAYAVCETPEYRDGNMIIRMRHTEKWHIKGEEPADIPVLPDTGGETVCLKLIPYTQEPKRITMFPRENRHV